VTSRRVPFDDEQTSDLHTSRSRLYASQAHGLCEKHGRRFPTDGQTDEMECYVSGPERRVHELSYPAVCDKNLCQGPAMARRLAAHGLNRVHRRAWCTGGGSKDGCEPRGMKGRHDGGPINSDKGLLQGFYNRLGRQSYAFEKEKLRQDDVRRISWGMAMYLGRKR